MATLFLIDANLPAKVPVWTGDNFVSVLSINPAWDDDEIWQYAKHHNLVIVTKDKDFIVKQLTFGVPPKVVHIKFGNLKLKPFIERIAMVWPDVIRMMSTANTINIYSDKIEAIK